MDALLSMTPFIRVSHHYIFPLDQRPAEIGRIGYCYALHLVDDGQGSLIVQGKRYALNKGDLLFIPPACEHSFESGSSRPLSTYNIYCELWSDEPQHTESHLIWNPTSFNRALLTEIRTDTDLDRIPLVFPLFAYSDLIVQLTAIVKQHQKQTPRSAEAAHLLLKGFILCLVEVIGDPRIYADPRMLKIMDSIERGAFRESGYKDWLRQSGLSKTQFHQLFKSAAGMSPTAYWKRSLMNRAAAALLESNQSVTEVASQFGFSSIHHFTKQFTQFHGASPTKFRGWNRAKEFHR